MTRTIRSTAAAMGLLAAGVSVGLAARPGAGENLQADLTAATITRAKAERVEKLARVAVYYERRVEAGIALPQQALMAKSELYRAKADAAATEAERLAMLKVALETLKAIEVNNEEYVSTGKVGSVGGPSVSDFMTQAVETINRTAELEIAIAQLEAKRAK